MITIDTRNVKYLEEFFDEQSKRDKRGIIIASYRKAVKPLVTEAKNNAPVGRSWVGKKAVMGKAGNFHVGGGLRKSIGTMEDKTDVAIFVGAMRPKGAHGHLVEDGTAMRSYITKKNRVQKSTGRVTASHFFEAAYNSTQQEIYNTVADEWFKSVIRSVDKLNAKVK